MKGKLMHAINTILQTEYFCSKRISTNLVSETTDIYYFFMLLNYALKTVCKVVKTIVLISKCC